MLPPTAAATLIGVTRAAGTAHLLVAEEAADDAVATVARCAAKEALMLLVQKERARERKKPGAHSLVRSKKLNCDKAKTQKKNADASIASMVVRSWLGRQS